MASTHVIRVTMFKFPKKADQEAMLENFDTLWRTAVKDEKPYVLSLEAGPTSDDSNPNYNFVGKSVFRSMEDMEYDETECAAHASLKAKAAKELELQGIMTVYFTPALSKTL